ncbi:MAG: hypothetical protein QOJ62_2784 [Actinomycetota bacterium]|nr:hypothetical protein [Actinomycetota bacterium]
MIPATVTDSELKAMIAAERRELADALAGLSAGFWEMQTLCAGWRVREVVAHLTMPFRYSTARFLAEMVRDAGHFNRMADRCARRDAAMATAELVTALKENATNPWKPPGGGLEGALTHDVVHGLDFTLPLGIDRQVPEERLRAVLANLTRPKPLKFFGVDLNGIELRADDIDWRFGDGEPVFGAAQDLVLVLCGRRLPAGHLRGELTPRLSYADQS